MKPELITAVLDDLSKVIGAGSAEALTCTNIDSHRVEFKQDSYENGRQVTSLFIMDRTGKHIYKLNVELTDNVKEYEASLKDVQQH